MEEPYHHSYGRIQVPNSYFTPIVFGSLENRKILVWRLPRNIAQSRLAGRKKSSNACTLICLTCSEILVNCMANAILEGNEVHESVLNEQAWRRQNFTIPEAIMATGHLFCELDYCSVRGSIKADLPRYLLGGIQSERLHSLSQLFFLLIAVHRCVVIVYDRSNNIIGFMDSHDHHPLGSMIASTSLDNLHRFSYWLEEEAFSDLKYLEPAIQNFELSSICFTATTGSIKDRLVETRLDHARLQLSEVIFPPNREDQKVTREIRRKCDEALAKEKKVKGIGRRSRV